MVKVLFVCHGNICRSPMAEFMFKDMVKKLHKEDQFEIASAATSREEIGNPVHYGTRNKLAQFGISVAGKYARQMTKQDYEHYDYVLIMDHNNYRNTLRIIGQDKLQKVHLLLDFTARKGQSIADPWYTGDFDITYNDIKEGLEGFYSYLVQQKYIY
ncbi:MAG: low molecular weight phosphotyrosine protein phosphatase [Phascolarctobacterium sp.]|nr:low molecular weight phosphotyrosine protein phosphatase [Phascolarctobacterium sp.]